MPEGDTIHRTATRLSAALDGRVLSASDFRVPRYATLDLSGRRVERTSSYGKHLLSTVGDVVIRTHLRMDGRWDVHPLTGRDGAPSRPRWRRPAHQARLVLRNERFEAVGFLLGELEVVPVGQAIASIARLGPDLLAADFDARGRSAAEARVAAGLDRPVAELLLDQTVMAGLGNVFVNEVCFLFGRHPAAPATGLDATRLVDRCHRLLWTNRDRSRRTTTGRDAPGERTHVYGRRGQPCRRCGTRIVSAEFGPRGLERISYWCPHCQPAP